MGTIAQFFHFVAEEKNKTKKQKSKKDDKKTKAFYDWATTGIPVMKEVAPSGTVNASSYWQGCIAEKVHRSLHC